MDHISRKVQYSVAGDEIVGTFYLPAGSDQANLGCVVLGHGWGMVAGGDLEDYAKAIVARGLAALTFDYRNLGKSGGAPRQHIDPSKQVEDYKTAISFVRSQPEVDGARIGVWGSSYGGGHALTVTATDPRVRCVVSQVPTISSWQAARARMDQAAWSGQWQTFIADREAVFHGAEPATIQSVSEDPDAPVAYRGRDSFDYMTEEGRNCPEWRNYTTIASLELARNYEPGSYLYRITDVPVLMIIADSDTITPTDLQRAAFTALSTEKKLLVVEGGHYSVYREHFQTTSTAAADWFAAHLK
ncbi:alpha/beta hydrolase [Brucella pituitosa]|uniref:Alpha/beta hydrolase n=1 Tax=Brucella intermedia GD04153 TaxID=2975438 RepID=A0AA42KUM0_9HYPH|nr:alpha/beta hydrolase [Brucella intermedia]MDH0127135.1 alpha/beta hydrolase [Brucella intermedia GD04153]RRD21691.1 alpha/beta hydrolase [Brucellaceae bacterium VT-16-1752]